MIQLTKDTKAINNPEDVAQDSVMPAEEQKAPEVVETAEAAQETGVSETVQTTTEDSLSEGASDRSREQFEKLVNSNKELKEQLEGLQQERSTRIKSESVYKAVNAEQPIEQFADPLTGNIDIPKFNKALTSLERNAKEAKAEVQRYKEEQQAKEAYASYPQLDPDSKSFDIGLHKITRGILLDSMLNPADYGGKPITMVEAAKQAAGGDSKIIKQVKQQAAAEVVEKLTPKEQASLEATSGRNARPESLEPMEDLAYKTQRGDKEAILKRMKGVA